MTPEQIKARVAELRKSKIIDRSRSGNLIAFTQYTWQNYFVNWHHQVLGKFLTRFIRKEFKRAMVFMPPRHGKSELVSRRLPALIHGMYPDDEVMAATYSGDLAGDMTVDVQRIMDTPEYQELFPQSKITGEGKLSSYARNKAEHELVPIQRLDGSWYRPTGNYRAQGVGGSFGGRGGNWIFVDDPIKNREDADSKTVRENVWKFYTSTLRTRQEGDASILITTTRWHEDDLAGRLIAQAKADPKADQWEILCFPALKYEIDASDNGIDPRMIGEALWPTKFNEKWLESQRATSERDWWALYQQKPTSEGGNIFKAADFKRYKVIPTHFDCLIQSWDFAVKDKSGSDYTVGQVWGRLGADKFLVAQIRGRLSFPDSCKAVMELSRRFPQAFKKLIEAKANGPAVKQTLARHVSGIVEIEPRGDKIARANAIAPEVQSGNVWIPDPSIAPWIEPWITEMCEFPNGAHDDQVDAATQALDELRNTHKFALPIAGGHGVIF